MLTNLWECYCVLPQVTLLGKEVGASSSNYLQIQ